MNPLTEVIEDSHRRFRPVNMARITSHVNMYHQLPNEDARQFAFVFDRLAQSSDISPYQRTITVGTEWITLGFDWIPFEDLGCIILVNKTGDSYTVNPTKEQKELDDTNRIFVSPFRQMVPPKSVSIIYPDAAQDRILVSSAFGNARLEYIGIPK